MNGSGSIQCTAGLHLFVIGVANSEDCEVEIRLSKTSSSSFSWICGAQSQP